MAERKKHRAGAHSAKPAKDVRLKGAKRGGEDEILLSDIGGGGKKKRLSRGKKATIIILSVVAALILTIVINPFNLIERLQILYKYDGMTNDLTKLGSDGVIDEGVVNIALFGIDTRQKGQFSGLSDSIMILSLDKKKKTVKIVSVMRDSLLPIYDKAHLDKNTPKKYSKINAAYADSPETAVITLNKVFGLDISEYATVNFFGMSEIIDAVGGIDITVTEDELKWKGHDNPNLNNCMDEICRSLGISASKYYIKAAGTYHVNGIQAVAYSRVRHCRSVWGTNDDYGRTDRQRYVMEQLFNKALKIDSSKYASLVKSLRPHTKTSLEIKKILELANSIFGGHPTFEQARMPADNWQMSVGTSKYGSVLYFDKDYAKDALHAFLYDGVTFEEYAEKNGVGKTDWLGVRGKQSTDSGNTSSENKETSSKTSSGSSETAEPPEDKTGNDTGDSGSKNEGGTDGSGGNTGDTGSKNEGGTDGSGGNTGDSGSTGDSGGKEDGGNTGNSEGGGSDS